MCETTVHEVLWSGIRIKGSPSPRYLGYEVLWIQSVEGRLSVRSHIPPRQPPSSVADRFGRAVN